MVREEAVGSRKYSLGNPPADTSWERLAFMQPQRFWIERAFQDATSELGLADYELRGWAGWHHRVALVCLAQLFTVIERRLSRQSRPLLSVRDITELLEIYLPRRPRTEEEVLRKISQRHRARAADIRRRQKTAGRVTKSNLTKKNQGDASKSSRNRDRLAVLHFLLCPRPACPIWTGRKLHGRSREEKTRGGRGAAADYSTRSRRKRRGWSTPMGTEAVTSSPTAPEPWLTSVVDQVSGASSELVSTV